MPVWCWGSPASLGQGRFGGMLQRVVWQYEMRGRSAGFQGWCRRELRNKGTFYDGHIWSFRDPSAWVSSESTSILLDRAQTRLVPVHMVVEQSVVSVVFAKATLLLLAVFRHCYIK